ncbi:isochorismatase family protein [Priestia filamentosa]|uniref:isochorismatase family protein n=1 Tax=Priestia filamentosa TaxID=1402861 RepID=UPI002E1EFE7B|nr:isochorismatase family protein [Priestia filamentosa]
MGLPSITSYNMPTEKDFPKNRVNWTPDASRAVLLVHDMQEYFLNSFDREQSPVPELVEHISLLKKTCDNLGIPVVYTAQPGNQDPRDRALLQDFWGEGLKDDPEQTSILKELSPSEKDVVLTKWRYSAFKRTDLLERMKKEGRDQLIICGVYAHIGCLITAGEAFMEDIQAFFVGDALGDFSLENHNMALRYASERCAFTLSTNNLIHQLESKNGIDVKGKVASLLEISQSEIDDNDDLTDLGLDSIRIMSLVEEWRDHNEEITFMTLAEQPTIAAWTKLLSQGKEKTFAKVE